MRRTLNLKRDGWNAVLFILHAIGNRRCSLVKPLLALWNASDMICQLLSLLLGERIQVKKYSVHVSPMCKKCSFFQDLLT